VPKPSPLEELDALIDSDEELIISLTSSQIVRNFKKIIGANRLQRLSSRSKLRLISIGPETSMTIREELPELALSISEATEASMKSMVDLLMV
jgi:uroporphyrinogen-III synthase